MSKRKPQKSDLKSEGRDVNATFLNNGEGILPNYATALAHHTIGEPSSEWGDPNTSYQFTVEGPKHIGMRNEVHQRCHLRRERHNDGGLIMLGPLPHTRHD
jgi:hypothetical protein